MKAFYLLSLSLLFIATLPAQEDFGAYYGITCATQDTFPEAFLAPNAQISSGQAQVVTPFIFDFTDEVPQEARAAMQFAGDVWGAYLNSAVPVRVSVDWQDRNDDRLLASAGPGTLFRDFPGSLPNTWYPVALAEAIAGFSLNEDDQADIRITANSTANWYFALDGNTPRNRIDLPSVMLHELGHGLGFLSSVDTINETQLAIGFGDRFIVYDLFLETPTDIQLTDRSMFNNPSDALLRAVINNDLLFDGPAARAVLGEEVPLFAPGTFDVGSSVSHLSEFEFRPGTANALMTPFLSAGEAVHDPGPVTLGIFQDLGWPVVQALVSTRPTAQTANVRVFPNPARERLLVRLGPSFTTQQLALYNSQGRLVRSQMVADGGLTQEVNLRGLPSGYYVLLGQGDRPWRRPVVVR